MKQINLTDNLTLSQIVYGVWRWDDKTQSESEVQQVIETCLELGVDSFDHADIYNDYSNEAFFGRILGQNPSLRNKLKIVTKCGIQLLSDKKPNTYVKHYNYSPGHITTSVETSLKKLNTDYIDVLLFHRPSPLMDVDEAAKTLEGLVQSGKVKHVGVSNFTPAQFSLLQSRLSIPLVTNQVELSILHHAPLTDGSLDYLYEKKVKPMIWSPLAGGSLFKTPHLQLDEAFTKLGEQYNASKDVLALAWLLRHPAQLVPVIGTNKIERIKAAVSATNINLELQDWFVLYEAAMGDEVP